VGVVSAGGFARWFVGRGGGCGGSIANESRWHGRCLGSASSPAKVLSLRGSGIISRRTRANREEREAHRDYSRVYSEWIHSLEEQAECGNKSARALLDELASKKLLAPIRLEEGYGPRNDDENSDPVERMAIVPAEKDDRRVDIADFASVTLDELDALSEQFGSALQWASAGRPDLLVMGARWVTMLTVMRPCELREMQLPARAMKQRAFQLRGAIGAELDPIATGYFYRRLFAWVRDCTSLGQLGQRGYSLIYVMRNDLLGGMTCEQIGSLRGGDGDTRQAANKPIQDFRDTFRGFKNGAMRDDETRKKCKRSQLRRSRT
jgi:hypothetical protein